MIVSLGPFRGEILGQPAHDVPGTSQAAWSHHLMKATHATEELSLCK
jgi:hypothetical protein